MKAVLKLLMQKFVTIEVAHRLFFILFFVREEVLRSEARTQNNYLQFELACGLLALFSFPYE